MSENGIILIDIQVDKKEAMNYVRVNGILKPCAHLIRSSNNNIIIISSQTQHRLPRSAR